VEYFEVIGATAVVLLLSYLLGAVLRGAGDSRTPLKAAVIANIINVFATYALINGEFGLPVLGVAGSAWGSTIARSIAALYMLRALWRGKAPVSIHARGSWWPQRRVGVDLFRLGIPAAIEQILMEAGFTILVAIVATIGTNALTAQQISFTAMSLGFLPGLGFAITATALVGQSVGARRMEDARKAAAISQRMALLWMGAGTVLFVLAPRPIIDLFTDDPEVIAQGINGLRAIGVSLPLWGVWMVSAGSLRGSGDTRGPMIRGVITVWAAVALAWIGVRYFDQGIGWVWGTFVITSPIAGIGNLLAFRKRSHALEEEFLGGAPVSGVPVHHP
jgi:putative MATE family efflux protein